MLLIGKVGCQSKHNIQGGFPMALRSTILRASVFNTLAGSSLMALASVAGAQTPGGSGSTAESQVGLEEIIVSARRKEESVQDVPQTVNAVTAATIEKLNILKFDDVQAITPGVTLSSGNTGYTTAASMRGVSFNVESGAQPTVAFYLNDAPTESNFLFQSMYDVSQIEVLRGPQGTLRGRASPSGAITVSTHKADLSEIGGYATATVTDRDAYNVNGAFNLPIVKDVWAIRFAGITQTDEFDAVKSVNNSQDPESKSNGWRVTTTFQPIDTLSMSVTYDRLVKHIFSYAQVTGSGGPGGLVVNDGTTIFTPPAFIPAWPAPPAGFNGPVIASGDRLSVQDARGDINQNVSVLNGQLQWSFLGQRLNYVGSYNDFNLRAKTDTDIPNYFPDYSALNNVAPHTDITTHELRLSSDERLVNGLLDYTVGVFYQKNRGKNTIQNGPQYLQGAFGSPFAPPNPAARLPNEFYKFNILIDSDYNNEETSGFANLTFHFSDRTELSVGGRYISYKPDGISVISHDLGHIALPLAALGGAPSCAAAGLGSTYPGTCDAPIAPAPLFTTTDNKDTHPWIYSASLSHRFTDSFMVYANTGTSWRAGPTVQGINSDGSDPGLNALVKLKDEKSTSYELGAKSQFFDKRVSLNAAVYHQTFSDLISRVNEPINYLQPGAGGRAASVAQYVFSYNADAIVDGVDVDASWQVLPHWNLGAAVSYADGHVDNQPVPCNDSNFDGTPDSGAVTAAAFQAAGKSVAYCQSSQAVSRAPLWSTSLQTEYFVPVASAMDVFFRGLVSYYPENKHASPNFTVDSYGLLNIYAGIRSQDAAWEVSLFGKNITDTNTTLSKDNVQIAGPGGSTGYFGQSGYYNTTYTPRREFGISLRYAFGSR
jgi:iron complex outermembrane recepter protein